LHLLVKSSNSFVVSEYSLIASAMEGKSLNKCHFLVVVFLLGLSQVPGKLHVFILGEIVLDVWLDV
jgi:hypothetical protein